MILQSKAARVYGGAYEVIRPTVWQTFSERICSDPQFLLKKGKKSGIMSPI